jgi:hypothetical protein
MTTEIQKNNGSNITERDAQKNIFRFWKKSFFLFVVILVIIGLMAFAASGLLPRTVNALITYIFVVMLTTYHFVKFRETFKNKFYWLVYSAIIIFYSFIAYHYSNQPPTIGQEPHPGLINIVNITPLSSGKEFHVDARIQNYSGEVPAYNFKSEIHLVVAPKFYKEHMPPKDYHPNSEPFDFQPKQIIHSPIGIAANKITPEFIEAIDNKEIFIVLWYAMEYKDASGILYRPQPTVLEYNRKENEFILPKN